MKSLLSLFFPIVARGQDLQSFTVPLEMITLSCQGGYYDDYERENWQWDRAYIQVNDSRISLNSWNIAFKRAPYDLSNLECDCVCAEEWLREQAANHDGQVEIRLVVSNTGWQPVWSPGHAACREYKIESQHLVLFPSEISEPFLIHQRSEIRDCSRADLL